PSSLLSSLRHLAAEQGRGADLHLASRGGEGILAPTWFVLKITFLLLAFCFTAMLSLAFFSSDFMIIAHVLLLVTIGTVLFVLLNRFLAETGLVPVEQQMKEMGIHKIEATEKDKGN
ncbi:Os07g0299600, partial [Oryza sativa Japonica Group]